jgi:MoxR-like ATPase
MAHAAEPAGRPAPAERVQSGEIAGAQALAERVRTAVAGAVEVRPGVLDDVMVCLIAEGHILIEDLPGVGKTTLARALARASGLEFARVQCTADLLPADVVGTNVFNQRESRFEFRPGPIFSNVVVVDEINRASPKTQSGLLECMQERRVTVDLFTHELARPFVVLATQNPVEFEGTYPLPEAQVDRFMARLSLGYPSAQGEVDMLRAHEAGDRVDRVEAVAGLGDLLGAQEAALRVHSSDALRTYVVALLRQTREDPRVELGASPRAGLMLLRAAKARALLQGRDHALPDDVQELADIVLAHRIVLTPESFSESGSGVVADAVARVPAL